MSKIFSATERDFVKQLVVGKPSGVIVEIGGIDINLVPLTTQQGKDVISLIDRIVPLMDGAKSKQLDVSIESFVGLLKSEADRVLSLARELLWRSVVANQLVDQADEGQDVFDEWFNSLDFVPTMRTLISAIGPANGMGSILGNPSTPPTANAVETSGESPAAESPESE